LLWLTAKLDTTRAHSPFAFPFPLFYLSILSEAKNLLWPLPLPFWLSSRRDLLFAMAHRETGHNARSLSFRISIPPFLSFHSERSEEPALAVAFAFLVVIPQGSAVCYGSPRNWAERPLTLLSHLRLSFP
jgi:hypothetical protein